MKEKYQTATDESYRDLTNIPAKLQKHQAFEAELKANSDRLKDLNKVPHFHYLPLFFCKMLTGHDVRNIGTQLFQAAIEFPLSLDVHSSLLDGQHLCV